jgi:ribose 1,5-bisphosphokinase
VSGRLIYIVGPSGAGKDALLDYARSHLAENEKARVRFARRWITRPAGSVGEDHQSVTHDEFERMVAAGQFAMAWRANGNGYGIGQEIRDWLADGATVVVSGSREYLPQALKDFPDLKVVSVTVSPQVLRGRLEKRGRESAEEIVRRLERAAKFALPEGIKAVEIRNDLAVEEAGMAMLKAILGQ